jgi:membrane protein implicated in regulation of membrane protease activity
MKEDKNGTSKLAIILSFIALILAALVSVFNINLWLAGTQWILISVLLAVYATYMKKCDCKCCEDRNKQD